MSAIQLCTPYTPLPKLSERKQQFSVNAYGWVKQFAPERQLDRENILPAGDREKLLRLWEDTAKQVERERYPDQDDFCNQERQLGKVMRAGELIARLQKLNPDLIVQDSNVFPDQAAFYVMRDGQLTYTNASFPKGHVPEHTQMHEDTAGRPVYYPTYGWRTVLVRLLKFGAITWQDVLDTFGDVKFSDSRGKHWAANVAGFRN